MGIGATLAKRFAEAGAAVAIHGFSDYDLMKNTSASDKRKYYHVRLLCKEEIRQQIAEYLNPNIIDEHNDGNFIIELHVPFERIWFSLLLGFGNQVEVIEPQEIKMMLKQKAEEILSVY